MSDTLKLLRALADPTRLRILAALERDELSVNELQDITRLGQSRISTHLGLVAGSMGTINTQLGNVTALLEAVSNKADLALLKATGLEVEAPDVGCCGMARRSTSYR